MMARATGLEPATSGVTGRRSNQLSYARSPKKRALVKRAVTRRSVYVTPDSASSTPARGSVRQGLVGGERVELPTSSV